jgi:formate dehydrogenase accessory protein FdhE
LKNLAKELSVGIAHYGLETHNLMMPDPGLSDRSPSNRPVFNRTTAEGEWQRRIARAAELGAQYSFASEILRFYSSIAVFQKEVSKDFDLSEISEISKESVAVIFAGSLPLQITRRFRDFISVVEQKGTEPLRNAAGELKQNSDESHFNLLKMFWEESETTSVTFGPNDFFPRAYLQPYAAAIRAYSTLRWSGPAPYLCPLCHRKPGSGVLRPLGDGGQRSLICSFCLAEWEFRRIVCPGCGEENHAKLPVYTAEELKHVRVEACDSCRIYIKTVDMTKNGLAEPVVDELAAVPLDLWAQNHGYTKLQPNLLQL